jgi:hypothetical protein
MTFAGEEHALSMISMKILASGSDNARIFVRSSFDDKSDPSISANSADLGSRGGRKCNPGRTLFENPGSQVLDNGYPTESTSFDLSLVWGFVWAISNSLGPWWRG